MVKSDQNYIEKMLQRKAYTSHTLELRSVFDSINVQILNNIRVLSENTEVLLKDIYAYNFDQYLSLIKEHAVACIIIMPRMQNTYGIISISNNILQSVVSCILGAKRQYMYVQNSAMEDIHNTKYTAIEIMLIKKWFNSLVLDIKEGLGGHENVQVYYERMEMDIKFTNAIRRTNNVTVAQYTTEITGEKGLISIILPEYVSYKLKYIYHQHSGEALHDRIWQYQFYEKVMAIEFRLDSVLANIKLTLDDIKKVLVVGASIPLNIQENSKVSLTINKKPILYGYMGSKNNNISIKVTQKAEYC